MKIFRLLVLLACLLLLTVFPVIAQTEQDEDPPFAINYDDHDPIIERGAYRSWDGRFTSVGAAFFHDGQYHMFRNGYPDWPRPSGIAYHVSDDGMTWEQVGDEPVIAGEAVNAMFDVETALVYSVLVDEDGMWRLYFQGFPPEDSGIPGGVILATAEEPTGEWTIREDMVIMSDGMNSWDNGAIGGPSVIVVDGEYRMYYHGRSGTGIGVATSEDGITWTKHDDPATTDVPFANSDPIFLPAEDENAWDYRSIYDPTVVVSPDGFVMAYSANPSVVAAHGLAISEDGLNFERLQDKPIFSRRDLRPMRNFWLVRMMYHDERYFFFAEIDHRGGTAIYADIIDGLLTQ